MALIPEELNTQEVLYRNLKLFKMRDINEDGKVTREEFVVMMGKFFNGIF